MWNKGQVQNEAQVYSNAPNICVTFIPNMDPQNDTTVNVKGVSCDLSAWSVNILPDCKNFIFNATKDKYCDWEASHDICQGSLYMRMEYSKCSFSGNNYTSSQIPFSKMEIVDQDSYQTAGIYSKAHLLSHLLPAGRDNEEGCHKTIHASQRLCFVWCFGVAVKSQAYSCGEEEGSDEALSKMQLACVKTIKLSGKCKQ